MFSAFRWLLIKECRELLVSRAKRAMTPQPMDGLDLRQTRDAASALRVHARRGRTLFLSIHQISDAARFCDRFVLLSGGHVCGERTVTELAERCRGCGAEAPRKLKLAPRDGLHV